jgi:predicted cobalt transporter CbtA
MRDAECSYGFGLKLMVNGDFQMSVNKIIATAAIAGLLGAGVISAVVAAEKESSATTQEQTEGSAEAPMSDEEAAAAHDGAASK